MVPERKNLLFFSVDSSAVVRRWIWARGGRAPRLLGGLQISDGSIDGPAVARVHTPLMIVQGENDFVSVQQSEEYFSSLYRQNKRAESVRSYGEAHTITRRANVIDLWRRIDVWLRETMPPR